MNALLALSAFCVEGCGVLTRSYTFYFKIVLTVLVDGVEHVGSTIVKGKWVDTLGVGDAPGRWAGDVAGDAAIVLGLGGQRALIALWGAVGNQPNAFLITNGLLLWIAEIVAPARAAGAGDGSQVFEILKDLKGEQVLPKEQYPVLAYFDNIDDLRSAKIVPPNPESGFAPNVEITRFTLSLTNGPESSGLKDRLLWYKSLGTFPPIPAIQQAVKEPPAYYEIMPQNIHMDEHWL